MKREFLVSSNAGGNEHPCGESSVEAKKQDTSHTKEAEDAVTTPKRRRSSRDTNRICLPKSTLQRQRFESLFFNRDTSQLGLEKVNSCPNIYVVDDFLSESDLAFLETQIQQGGFKRSYVDRIEKEGSQSTEYDSEHRTSTFVSFQHRQNAKIAAIERRACELLGVWNTDAVEPLQLVRYRKGEFFGKHHDLGDLDEERETVSLPVRNLFSKRRLATIFCYLNDLPEGAGGETHFPDVRRGGLKVQPKKGRAVLFSNVKLSENGDCLVPDEKTVHEGLPVESGVKYGLNIWICED